MQFFRYILEKLIALFFSSSLLNYLWLIVFDNYCNILIFFPYYSFYIFFAFILFIIFFENYCNIQIFFLITCFITLFYIFIRSVTIFETIVIISGFFPFITQFITLFLYSYVFVIMVFENCCNNI